jgi:lipooligosaccharide transport system permease protein
MKPNDPSTGSGRALSTSSRPLPSLFKRLSAVWMRHYTVYSRNFFTNSFYIVVEPVIFIMAVGWGLASTIHSMDGMDYLSFIAPGQVMVAAVFSASFDMSYGTYFRMEMDHNYDSMLVTPLSVSDIFWGELIYHGTKGAFFSTGVLAVFAVWGLVHSPWALLVPFVGFLTAVLFGSLGLFAVRLVRDMTQFNFFISGVISPLTLFSGTLFPVDKLPKAVAFCAYWLPLFHPVHLCRMLTTGIFESDWPVSLAYTLIVPWVLGFFAVKSIRPKLIQ